MEEAAPVAVSGAGMRLPGEVYKPQAGGAPKAEGELTQWVVLKAALTHALLPQCALGWHRTAHKH